MLQAHEPGALTGQPGTSYPSQPPEERSSRKMLVCPLCRIALGPNDGACPRDGREGRPLELDPLPADLSERFKIVEPFGAGETGALYLADEVQTGRRGILKVLHSKGGASVSDRQRLKRELVKQATLANPHLALPLVTGEAAGATWLFREWVEGVSLRVRLARDGQLPVPEALAVAAQLASALDELHRAGLLHRDLQPGHVMLQPQPSGVPRVVLIDAGIAAQVRSQTAFDVAGTPAYVSPEQASGKLVSFRSDLYALGCVLHEMVTGAPPYGGSVEEVLQAHAEAPVPTAPAQLPGGVQTLLGQLLSKEPRERPFSAQQARRSIDPFLPEGGSPRDPTVSFEPQHHSTPTNGRAAGSGTLRPPQKATLLGIPAAAPQLGNKPPPPPPEQGVAATGGPNKPPPPPGTAAKAPAPPVAAKQNADTTQELDALDIEEIGAPVVPQALGAAAAPTPAAPTPEEPAPAAAGAPTAELDYDDLAETTLHVSRDMELEAEMPKPLEGAQAAPQQPARADQGIPPTHATPAVSFDQAKLEEAAASFVSQQPSPESSGGFAQQGAQQPAQPAQPAAQAPAQGWSTPQQAPAPQAQENAWNAQEAPAVVEEEPPSLPKKKSRAGVFVLVGVLVFCLGSAGALGTGYWYFTNQAEQELAQLGADWTEAMGPQAGAAPADPTATGEAAPGDEPAALGAPELDDGEAADTQAANADTDDTQAAAPAAQADEAPAPSAREADRGEERQARATREREERSGRGEREARGGASQFDQLRNEAREHFRARRFAQAAAAYERAAAINPNHAGTYAGLGAARGAMGDSRGAVAAYQRAVEAQPNHSGFTAALGRAYMMAGDRGRAIQAFQRAVALDPNNQAARQGLQQLGAAQ